MRLGLSEHRDQHVRACRLFAPGMEHVTEGAVDDAPETEAGRRAAGRFRLAAACARAFAAAGRRRDAVVLVVLLERIGRLSLRERLDLVLQEVVELLAEPRQVTAALANDL